MTFLAQYYRVLAVARIQIMLITAMIVIGSWSLSQVLVGIFICTPVAGFWDKSLDPKCIAVPLEWYINSAGNIATDIVIFVLPMPILGHLRLPKVEKLVLVGIFSLGFFTCAISVIRMKYLQQGGDQTYDNIGGSSWSITELCSGVLCACLPTLRPLASKYMPSVSRRLHGSSGGSRGYGYRNYSDSRRTDVEKGADDKHTRTNSDATTANTDPYPSPVATATPGIRRPLGNTIPIAGLYDSDDSTSSSSRPSESGYRRGPWPPPTPPPPPQKDRRYEFVALTPWQADAQRLSSREPEGNRNGGRVVCPRMAPQVTTEIVHSHSPPPHTPGLTCPNSAICVKHVVVVEKS